MRLNDGMSPSGNSTGRAADIGEPARSRPVRDELAGLSSALYRQLGSGMQFRVGRAKSTNRRSDAGCKSCSQLASKQSDSPG